LVLALGVPACRQGVSPPTGKTEEKVDLPGGGSLRVLHPPASHPSHAGATGPGFASNNFAWTGDKPGNADVLVDPLGLNVNGRDYGLYQPGDAVVVDARDGFKVSVDGQERQPAPEGKPTEPPAPGHFRLSIEDRVATDSHVEKVITIEFPLLKSGMNKFSNVNRYCLLGIGRMSGRGGDLTEKELAEGGSSGSGGSELIIHRNKTKFLLSLRTEINKNGVGSVEGSLLSWPTAKFGSEKTEFSRVLPRGKKLSDVLSWKVQPGVYPVAKLLRLGRILEDNLSAEGVSMGVVEVPIRLLVVDR
jgi:hypothetical protein